MGVHVFMCFNTGKNVLNKKKMRYKKCVWGRSGSVEGLRVSSISSRAMVFEMSVLNALVGMGEKGKEGVSQNRICK